MSEPSPVDRATDLIAGAERVLVLTGAGISAESGVPTFRGDGGLWKSYRAEDLATPRAFHRDPRLVWEWYSWRRELVGRCVPNAAHLALAQLAVKREGVVIVTQNVDGLHAEAARRLGGDMPEAAMPLEIHGSLFVTRCTKCAWRHNDRRPVDVSSLDTLPRCQSCGALARPAVVWFGESLDTVVLERMFAEASTAQVCLVIGTSGVVQPAASIAMVTLERGGAVIEVNPAETPLTPFASVSIRAQASSVVPVICRAL